MIRIVLKRVIFDFAADYRDDSICTFDVDAPAVEAALRRGGKGESGFDSTTFVGIEVLDKESQT